MNGPIFSNVGFFLIRHPVARTKRQREEASLKRG